MSNVKMRPPPLCICPIEDNAYADVKPVQESCAAAYLAVLKAIDEYLFEERLEQKRAS